MSPIGVRFTAQSPLLSEALTLLHERPRTSAALARRVLGVRGGPAELAERCVRALLAGEERVSVDEDGIWRLRPAARADAPAPLRRLEYAVVDVETTGGSAARGGRVVEIAVVGVRNGRIVDEFASLVDPGIPIPRWVSRLTGISDATVEKAPPFRELSERVRDALHGRVFVAHNASFDWRFVSEEMRRATSELPTGPRLCTVRLARRALPGLRRRGLDSLARYYDVEIRDRHRAHGDARATAVILPRLLAEAERTAGISRWEQLELWLRGEAPGEAAPGRVRC